jgi:serine/threonine protein kinase
LAKIDNEQPLVAVKLIPKNKIMRSTPMNEEKIRAEGEVLKKFTESKFIIKLEKTSENKNYLCLTTEFCSGGDLQNELLNLRASNNGAGFEETDMRFYSACVIEAINEIHDQNIIYRDLKPENILIADDGYVKIADFGLAQ